MLQREVAEQLGISDCTLLLWENGRATPEDRYLPRIMSFLGYDPRPEPRTFGEQLVAARQSLGLPRKRAAKLMGVDEGTLTLWEQGKRRPSKRRQALAQKFLTRTPLGF